MLQDGKAAKHQLKFRFDVFCAVQTACALAYEARRVKNDIGESSSIVRGDKYVQLVILASIKLFVLQRRTTPEATLRYISITAVF